MEKVMEWSVGGTSSACDIVGSSTIALQIQVCICRFETAGLKLAL